MPLRDLKLSETSDIKENIECGSVYAKLRRRHIEFSLGEYLTGPEGGL